MDEPRRRRGLFPAPRSWRPSAGCQLRVPAAPRSRSNARSLDGLSVLEPVADASSEELWNAAQFRLVPGQLGLEVVFASRPVLEKAVENKAARGDRNSDRRGGGEAMLIGRGKLEHGTIVSSGADTYQYW